jgi:putative MFS transporter
MSSTIASAGNPASADSQNERIAEVAARIDALASSKKLWTWLALIAAGGFFEIYDLALAAPLAPGLVAAGIFRTGHAGLFGFSDLATFISATFLGLYIGVVCFAVIGDKLGRKAVFGYALIWYAIATLIMGFQNDALSICIWRLIAGIGLGIESVAIDCYVVEIMPKRLRSRAFGITKFIEYCAVPVAYLLAAILIPQTISGIAGWRFLMVFPVIGAIGFWIYRRKLPESPLWLAARGRVDEAKAILDRFDRDQAIPTAAPTIKQTFKKSQATHSSPVVPNSYMVRAVLMMIVYFVFQHFSYYGFGHWVPTMLETQGVQLKQSLFYSFGIALAAPLGPLLVAFITDRFENKDQLVVYGIASICLGLLFAKSSSPIGWIGFGIALTFVNSVISFLSHAYQSEIFPTAIRARAVGFVYSFTRIAAAISGYVIAFILAHEGVTGVFVAISAFMIIALTSVAVFGPKTRNRSFKEITGQA